MLSHDWLDSTSVADSTLDKESERNRKRIEAYLTDMRLSFEAISHPRVAWALKVTWSDGFTFGVLQTKDRPNCITLDSKQIVSDAERQALSELSKADRIDFTVSMRLRLLDMGLDFYGVDDPLNTISVGALVFLDGLTKYEFSDRVDRIIRAKMAILWMIDQRLSVLRPNGMVDEPIN